MAMFMKMQNENLSTAMEDFDASALLAGMQLATGRPSEDALHAGDVPLSEAEPDMYPCLLALVGSGYGFMKVNIILCHRFYLVIFMTTVVALTIGKCVLKCNRRSDSTNSRKKS